MNKSELVEVMSYKAELTKAETEKVLNAFIEVVTHQVKKGNKVVISGLGQFERIERKARDGINPSTGQKIKIAAKKAPKFKAAKAFKDLVAG